MKPAQAIFAGGCFWCIERDFEQLPGVLAVESGYTGGHVERPSYYQVAAGGTGHIEAVRVVYDPEKLGYAQLLDYFWRHIDPTDGGGQFCDRGHEYTSAVFWQNEQERVAAEASRDQLLSSGLLPSVATQIVPATMFWVAEDYHQDYYKKNPLRYNFYRLGCGRDARVKEVWGG